MTRFIESICFKNENYYLLDLHQERINKTFNLNFPGNTPIKIKDILPGLHGKHKRKVRVVYGNCDYQIDIQDYAPKVIKSLKIIRDDSINYQLKSADRSALNDLYRQKGSADDIIIVKNGYVTDSSHSNLIFWDGEQWFTPNSYLLNGVKRQFLLKEKKIREMPIRPGDIQQFEQVSLVNALLDPGELSLSVSKIYG